MSLDGWIWLRGVQVPSARVGARPDERGRGQPLELDLGLKVPLAAAAASDRLADTHDWSALYARVQAEIGRRHWALVESLTVHLAEYLLAETGAREVFCEVRKPHSLASGCAAVSLHLSRSLGAPPATGAPGPLPAGARPPAPRPAGGATEAAAPGEVLPTAPSVGDILS